MSDVRAVGSGLETVIDPFFYEPVPRWPIAATDYVDERRARRSVAAASTDSDDRTGISISAVR